MVWTVWLWDGIICTPAAFLWPLIILVSAVPLSMFSQWVIQIWQNASLLRMKKIEKSLEKYEKNTKGKCTALYILNKTCSLILYSYLALPFTLENFFQMGTFPQLWYWHAWHAYNCFDTYKLQTTLAGLNIFIDSWFHVCDMQKLYHSIKWHWTGSTFLL